MNGDVEKTTSKEKYMNNDVENTASEEELSKSVSDETINIRNNSSLIHNEISDSEHQDVNSEAESGLNKTFSDAGVAATAVIADPGIDTILSKYDASKPMFGPYSEDRYFELCKYLKVIPVESFYSSLSKEKINLSFYGINPKGVRAMAEVLFNNPVVNSLNLEGNHLTCDAAYHLGEMLYRNANLLELNLKGCRIGPRGAEALANGLLGNTSLFTLNLADNRLEDEGMKFLMPAFTEHVLLRVIVLHNNLLTEVSAIRLGKIIEENCVLRELDLSWNYLNSTIGCKKLFAGISKSTSLEALNISWNGLTEVAVRPIAICLSKTQSLQKLDISNNSFNDECVARISRSLPKNGILKYLKIGMNPFAHEGAMALLEKMLKPTPIIEVLDLENKMVEKEFKELLWKVSRIRSIEVRFGGYRSMYKIPGPNIKELLLKRAKFVVQKKKRKDFGQFVLKLDDKAVKRDEFEDSLKVAKMKLDMDLTKEIMDAFKLKKRVDQREIKAQYLEMFPDTVLAVKKKRGKKRMKGDKAKKGKKK